MLIGIKTAIFALLVLLPEFELGWVTQGDSSRLRTSLHGYEAELSSCLASGLSIRFRYEFELCRKRSFWFDDCKGKRVAVSSVEFDPISETYVINSDLHGDIAPPVVERVTDTAKAIRLAANRSDITLSWLANKPTSSDFSENNSFRGRVYAECRGEYSESMKRLSYVLTFGLIRSSGFDSGWVEFER